ncbi:phosphopyruvate hydratase [Heterostelium album PN500]|uniref:phosphopyruvate hydratase n=1 Tax=Heterostelium pallidum (strain ATCC 26659 / Pp 5 / PN500) TaxID=670386 RepID=D3BH75_HETP5|nr:phosphopyruvate hydratase [Heterostelium album PN500]EFA79459.1 phosphopyruvate hydratase [Heterostelium album PN500]|eukprot:XP_020431580.1 phosphopyruvate hydratase [Heterostelium album PN500]
MLKTHLNNNNIINFYCILICTLVLATGFADVVSSEQVLLFADYESGTLDSGIKGLLATNANASDAATIVTTSRSGKYAISHKVTLDDPGYYSAGNWRSESATAGVAAGCYLNNTERRHEFSVYLKDWTIYKVGDPSTIDIIYQCKSTSSGPAWFLGVKRNQIVLRIPDSGVQSEIIADVSKVVNQWIDLKVEVYNVDVLKGYIRVYSKMSNETNFTLKYKIDNIKTFVPDSETSQFAYCKWGLYRPDSEISKGSVPTRIIYHDNIKITNTTADSGATTTTTTSTPTTSTPTTSTPTTSTTTPTTGTTTDQINNAINTYHYNLLLTIIKSKEITNNLSLQKETMSVIKSIVAREILDSRGNPTVEVDLFTELGRFRSAVPSGVSTSDYEAVELRDGDKSRYGGKGVLKALDNIKSIIAPKIIGMDVTDQSGLDQLMIKLDGTENKAKLGANAILAVSMAICRAGAAAKKIPLYKHIAQLSNRNDTDFILPVPAFNVINGGVHGGNRLAIQEFWVIPIGATTFKEALRLGSETYHTLKTVIAERYGRDAVNVGDEGGFAPPIQSNDEALDLLVSAIDKAGHTGKVKIGIDSAASEFHTKNGMYDLDFKNKNNNGSQVVSGEKLADMYREMVSKYPALVSFEDPFDEDDWDSYAKLTASVSLQVVGDDLLCTNPKRIQEGIKKKACNALLLKLNQIGTVSESIKAFQLARSAHWGVMVSHRSGETEDTFIADLVVGLGAGEIKTGATCRSERLAKYNQLMRIEEELGSHATFAGESFRFPK